jgi:D-proline reductase (dithiol) PrdB
MGVDADIRAAVDDLPVLEPTDVAYTAPKALADARVAIVTTAGLRTGGPLHWKAGDQGFTVLAGDARDLGLAHTSPNFDKSGFVADLNVVYPVDRLRELAERGVIGSVAPRHASFMGAQLDHELPVMRHDTGPAVAQLLKDDGVDVVLLTPV